MGTTQVSVIGVMAVGTGLPRWSKHVWVAEDRRKLLIELGYDLTTFLAFTVNDRQIAPWTKESS
jgi:hypothetical protein